MNRALHVRTSHGSLTDSGVELSTLVTDNSMRQEDGLQQSGPVPLSPSSRAISYLHKLSIDGQHASSQQAVGSGVGSGTDTNRSNIVEESFLDLPESLLPHLHKLDRRFKRGQVVGYVLIAAIFVFLAAMSILILAFSQRRTTVYSTDFSTSQEELQACSSSQSNCPAIAQVRYDRHRFVFVNSISLWIVFFIAAIMLTVYRGLGDMRRRKLVESLPSESIDLWQLTKSKKSADKRRNKQCFSRSMLLSIRDEFQRVIVLQKLCKELPKRLLEAPGDAKWGRSESGMCFHYQTSIAVSYKSLEEAATTYHPSLAMGPRESVRQYMERIKRSCYGIDHNICDEYVKFYESAKFGKSIDFNQQQYDKFISEVFYYLLKYLCTSLDKHLDPSLMKTHNEAKD